MKNSDQASESQCPAVWATAESRSRSSAGTRNPKPVAVIQQAAAAVRAPLPRDQPARRERAADEPQHHVDGLDRHVPLRTRPARARPARPAPPPPRAGRSASRRRHAAEPAQQLAATTAPCLDRFASHPVPPMSTGRPAAGPTACAADDCRPCPDRPGSGRPGPVRAGPPGRRRFSARRRPPTAARLAAAGLGPGRPVEQHDRRPRARPRAHRRASPCERRRPRRSPARRS